MIAWAGMSAEEILEALRAAPKVASVWQYSEVTRGYQRHILWHPQKGLQASWLDVASLWAAGDDRQSWHGYYNFASAEERKFGPFPDRFAAAAAVDAFLEQDGWKLCR